MTVTPSRPAPLATAGAPAPRAKVSATRHETHGVVRVDDYHWLRDRGDPAVTAYLEAENAYTRAVMAPTEALQETLFAEIKGRIRQTDMSVPYREGGHLYYTRYEDGREYPIHCRRPLDAPAPVDAPATADPTPADAPAAADVPRPDGERILLDVNMLAEGRDFCQVSAIEVSPDGRLLAYAIDVEGRRIHTIRVKDLSAGALLGDELAGGDQQPRLGQRQPHPLLHAPASRHPALAPSLAAPAGDRAGRRRPRLRGGGRDVQLQRGRRAGRSGTC